jgi:hypothetical protein
MPSVPAKKRSRLITAAVAGTLVSAAAVTTAAATLPSHPAAASAVTTQARLNSLDAAGAGQGNVLTSAQRLDSFARVRFSLGEVQYQGEVTAAKAAAANAAKAAAAKAAKAKAAAAKAAAARKAGAGTPSGSPQQIAQQMLARFGWPASQFSCLFPLWEHESGWNPSAQNPGSGAYGIPQSLPGAQMASAGADWQTNPATQIKWGLTYIQGRYGSPCGAWAHEQSDNWY